MKLIESSVTLLQQEEGLRGIKKQIELAGRTCYKSEDKMTEDSAEAFVDRMIESGHTAMLEHGTVYLQDMTWNDSPLQKYAENKYSVYKNIHFDKEAIYVTTNLRVITENGWQDDLEYICEPTEFHEKRITVKFACDRGVSHKEFVA